MTVYGKTWHMGSARYSRNARFQYLRSKNVKVQFLSELAIVVECQKQLNVKRKIMRQELREELMQVKQSLQEISSRPFGVLPPASAVTPNIGGGIEAPATASALATEPATYDGKTTWDAYRAQFELLAGLNHWNDEQKATVLAVNLRGPTATVLPNLPSEDRQNFEVLTAALESSAHQSELNRAQLRARMHHQEETLLELAEDVTDLPV